MNLSDLVGKFKCAAHYKNPGDNSVRCFNVHGIVSNSPCVASLLEDYAYLMCYKVQCRHIVQWRGLTRGGKHVPVWMCQLH